MPTPFTVSDPGLPRADTAQPAPFGAAAFTRRAVLQASGVASLAGLLGGLPTLGLGGVPRAYAADPTPAPTTPGAVDGQLRQPTPYYVQASCELSEDYFLTDSVIVSAGDRVMPFARADGTVEAIVLASGQLAHLARDASTVSGWTYTVISTGLPSITDAAVAASAAHGVSVLVVGPLATGPVVQASIVALGSSGVWSITSTGPLPNFQGARIAGGVTAAGDLYWYGWTQTVSNGQYVYQFSKWDGSGPNFGITHGRVLLQLSFPLATLGSIVNVVMLYDARPGATVPGFAVVTIANKNQVGGFQVNTYNQAGTGASGVFNPNATSIIGGVASLRWAYCTPTSSSPQPGILWQQPDGDVMFQDETGATSALYGDGASAGDGQLAAWLLDGLYAFTLIDDGVAQAVTQFGVSPNQEFTLPIPLVTGIDRVYSLPTDPTQATLFAVGADETLSVLTKDATTGWAQVPIHQDGATLQEITSWRTQISVLDANGTGVGNAKLQLSADQVVGVWQPAGNVVLSGAPLTLTTDGGGQLTFSIPATELDTAGLTAQALDPNGNPTGAAFAITPDIDVHRFLAGGSSLIDIGKLDGPALQNAKNADGTPLLPNLASVPSAQQAASATAIAGALNHAAALGFGSTPTDLNGAQAAKFDLSGDAPSFQTSNDPNAFDDLTAVEGISDWWDSAKNDARSAYHGLRHGAIKFKTMVTTWDNDLKQWTINLIVDIGSETDQLMTYVITDIDDAIHAISSFFNALGADIDKTWDWLKHHVLALIKDADANAKVLQSWFTPFFTSLTNVIDTIEIDTDTFFTNLEAQASAQIATLAAVVEHIAFGSSAPLPPPTPDTGSRDADLAFKAGQDVITFMRHSPGNWLLDKLRSHLPKAPTDGGPDFSDFDADMEQVIQDLVTDIADSINLIESIGTTLWDAVKPFLTNSGTFNQTSMGDFFTALEATVDDALKLINDVLITLLDAIKAAVAGIKDLLSYQFQAVPVIGDLLELAGVDTTLSIERIVSLIAAYPATLINDIIGGGPLFPPDNTPPAANAAVKSDGAPHVAPHASVGSERVDGWAVGLNWMSAVVQAVWSANDFFLDDGSAAHGFKGNALTTSLDIICPVVINMLQWPSPPTDAGLTQPFWAGINGKGKGTDLIPWMLFTAFVPPAAGIFYVVGDAKGFADAPDYNDYGVPIFCAIAGVANTVLSSIYGQDQGVGAASISFGVLSNVSYDVAPLGFPALNEAYEDVPALAKLIVDIVANFGTAVAMSSQAISAAIKPLTDRIPL